MKGFVKKMVGIYKEIGVVDQILVFLMSILVSHILLSMFLDTRFGPIDDDIDVIVRTSMASIFGYFLSNNFMKNDSEKVDIPITQNIESINVMPPIIENIESANIDPTLVENIEISNIAPPIVENIEVPLSANIETDIQNNALLNIDTKISHSSNEKQAMILGVFCVIVLSCLIAYRLINKDINPPTVTISQLRDLIAGCIGYLIGCPPSSKGN